MNMIARTAFGAAVFTGASSILEFIPAFFYRQGTGSVILLLAFAIMTNVACKPSPITLAEAKLLAIQAARASGVSSRFVLKAETDDSSLHTFPFHVFATNEDPNTSSITAGWFTVDKTTANLSDPIMNDQPIRFLSLEDEQRQLRVLHSQQAQ